MQYFTIILPVGEEFFPCGPRKRLKTYGRTDMMKLIIAVRNFAYAPKKLVTFQPYIRNTYTGV
jgi:hypothetical protein